MLLQNAEKSKKIAEKPKKIYENVDRLPQGVAAESITKGCLVLEGGAFRGLFTSGVIDVLMENDLNFECTIGVSAGALNGVNYVAGAIGRAGRINLTYRHDSRWVGAKAVLKNKGIIGFHFAFEELKDILPFDEKRFLRDDRRFVAVATDCLTGKPVFAEKGKCTDIYQAVRASASMPVVSSTVPVDGWPCLDGGCSVKIPVDWAIEQGYEKIIVVRSRDRLYRKLPISQRLAQIEQRLYHRYPAFLEGLLAETERYNDLCDHIDDLERQGRIFVLAPSEPISVALLEGDMDKLGDLYYSGINDAEAALDDLRAYLAQ